MDDYNREALHVEIDYSLPSKRVVYVLNRLTKKRGVPKKIEWIMDQNLSPILFKIGAP